MQRVLSSTRTQEHAAAKVMRQSFVSVSRNFTPLPNLAQNAVSKAVVLAPPGLVGTQAVRSYGTRSVWNVSRGKFMTFLWLIAFPIWAGTVQDYFGPYWFFHS